MTLREQIRHAARNESEHLPEPDPVPLQEDSPGPPGTAQTRLEGHNEEQARAQRLENDRREQDLRDLRRYRSYFVSRLFFMTALWLVVALGTTLLTGLGLWQFKLSDTVIVALLTTGMANLIGALVVIVRWLFPEK
ncbi:hypothetical protein [Deinococcus misasensis]|uniref:hypothetical protein n=1 Tax=Deinococcus misasensis TaxID=392413 RepID=UPI000555FFAC|nr:hypothetical protein [Deinococcus misasensis]